MATFFYPIQPLMCIFLVFNTMERYQNELDKVEGSLYKNYHKTSNLSRNPLIIFGMIELRNSVFVEVS